MSGKEASLGALMPSRVRRRRESRGISGADLARRMEVSPAYVSQIEKGLRVPDVPVALRMARALEDDEALYVAWSRDHKARSRSKSPGPGDDDAWTRLYRGDRFDDAPAFDRAVSSGDDIPASRDRATGARDLAVELDATWEHALESRPQGRPLVAAPVLEPGKDPGERDEVPRQLRVDEVLLDPRLFPGARLSRPFAFRADGETSRRVMDRISAGDLVVVSRDLEPGAPVPGRVYALRSGGRLLLGRLARFGDRFLVQPGPGETEMLDPGLAAGGPAKPVVAGEVVAVVRGT